LIATGTAALVARHPKHIELANEVAEDDCAIAGALGSQKVPSRMRVAAGAFGFLTFIQVLDGPERCGASSFFETPSEHYFHLHLEGDGLVLKVPRRMLENLNARIGEALRDADRINQEYRRSLRKG
jgi:hypothetical protein